MSGRDRATTSRDDIDDAIAFDVDSFVVSISPPSIASDDVPRCRVRQEPHSD